MGNVEDQEEREKQPLIFGAGLILCWALSWDSQLDLGVFLLLDIKFPEL